MKAKRAYTPAEIAEIVRFHLHIDEALRGVRNLENIYGKRYDSAIKKLISLHQQEIPENVIESFEEAYLLPYERE